jgi:hypothetical protein
MIISIVNKMKIVSAISVLCISIALVFPSCINEDSNRHSKLPSSDGDCNPDKIQFELDPIQSLAADGPGINFSKLIRNANRIFFDSLLFRIETKNTLDVIHRYDNSGLDIGSGYKIKNVGNFLFVDANKTTNMLKVINYKFQ